MKPVFDKPDDGFSDATMTPFRGDFSFTPFREPMPLGENSTTTPIWFTKTTKKKDEIPTDFKTV